MRGNIWPVFERCSVNTNKRSFAVCCLPIHKAAACKPSYTEPMLKDNTTFKATFALVDVPVHTKRFSLLISMLEHFFKINKLCLLLFLSYSWARTFCNLFIHIFTSVRSYTFRMWGFCESGGEFKLLNWKGKKKNERNLRNHFYFPKLCKIVQIIKTYRGILICQTFW